jgi:hypothetical protein
MKEPVPAARFLYKTGLPDACAGPQQIVASSARSPITASLLSRASARSISRRARRSSTSSATTHVILTRWQFGLGSAPSTCAGRLQTQRAALG